MKVIESSDVGTNEIFAWQGEGSVHTCEVAISDNRHALDSESSCGTGCWMSHFFSHWSSKGSCLSLTAS